MESQFSFLDSYVEDILRENGFENMNEETRAMFVPQFVAEAEQRLGDAITPRLSAEAQKELDSLLAQPLDQTRMRNFWTTHISGFDDVVAKTLEQFRIDVIQILTKNAA